MPREHKPGLPDVPGSRAHTRTGTPGDLDLPFSVGRLRRWPVGPLVETAGARSLAELAVRIEAGDRKGGAARSVLRALRRGVRSGLTLWTADRYANAIGLHPSLVWPDWYREPDDDDGDDKEEL